MPSKTTKTAHLTTSVYHIVCILYCYYVSNITGIQILLSEVLGRFGNCVHWHLRVGNWKCGTGNNSIFPTPKVFLKLSFFVYFEMFEVFHLNDRIYFYTYNFENISQTEVFLECCTYIPISLFFFWSLVVVYITYILLFDNLFFSNFL